MTLRRGAMVGSQLYVPSYQDGELSLEFHSAKLGELIAVHLDDLPFWKQGSRLRFNSSYGIDFLPGDRFVPQHGKLHVFEGYRLPLLFMDVGVGAVTPIGLRQAVDEQYLEEANIHDVFSRHDLSYLLEGVEIHPVNELVYCVTKKGVRANIELYQESGTPRLGNNPTGELA